MKEIFEKFGFKEPKHKTWDKCTCEECKIFQLKSSMQKEFDELKRQKNTDAILLQEHMKNIMSNNKELEDKLKEQKKEIERLNKNYDDLWVKSGLVFTENQQLNKQIEIWNNLCQEHEDSIKRLQILIEELHERR